MGFRDLLNRVLDRGGSGPGQGLDVDELARRLALDETALRNLKVSYHQFTIPKRTSGTRLILSPDGELKSIQRRVLHRLLKRIPVHPSAVGFERNRSIVTNALPHAGKAIVLKMDVKDFFGSTKADRVSELFKRLGWDREAAKLLTELCTFEGALPQGAPTSPRLSNLVNARMDARLAAVARRLGAEYTRYADDLTFSFAEDKPSECHQIIRITKLVLADFGYALHTRKKLHIRRRHQSQIVTGLAVNSRVQLPRKTRRWLRSVEHHEANGRSCTLTPAQLEGWRSFRAMVSRQARDE